MISFDGQRPFERQESGGDQPETASVRFAAAAVRWCRVTMENLGHAPLRPSQASNTHLFNNCSD